MVAMIKIQKESALKLSARKLNTSDFIKTNTSGFIKINISGFKNFNTNVFFPKEIKVSRNFRKSGTFQYLLRLFFIYLFLRGSVKNH